MGRNTRHSKSLQEPLSLRLKLALLPHAGKLTTGAFFASLFGSIWFLNSEYMRKESFSSAHKAMTKCFSDYQQSWTSFFDRNNKTRQGSVEETKFVPVPRMAFRYNESHTQIETAPVAETVVPRSLQQLPEAERILYLANYYLQHCARRSQRSESCATIDSIYAVSNLYVKQMRVLSATPAPEGQ
eukprot:TRINITY_DN3275_c0_g1_i2.p1 TRINITY_DN3275_c0_g1~~TRINITY_DN3275_c0_g1_i2.p1  ORF type:complete len:185 (-),score=31.49 TRINITY_DN3275_c0_g1_i2:408-962(-)